MKEVERPLTKIKRLYFGGNTAKKKKKPWIGDGKLYLCDGKKTPKRWFVWYYCYPITFSGTENCEKNILLVKIKTKKH